MVSDVISRVHGYVTRSDAKFVDRELEISSILGKDRVVVHSYVTVLYGPKGCGKTALFEALSRVVDPGSHGVLVVVARREARDEGGRVGRYVDLYAPIGFLEAIGRALERLARGVELRAGLLSVREWSIGEAVWKLMGALAGLEGSVRRVIVVADELVARDTAKLREWLEGVADALAFNYEKLYREKGREVSVVALTSDASVSEVRSIGLKVIWALMWNLPRRAAWSLAEQLGLAGRLGEELKVTQVDVEELLWRLAGGNPRALEAISMGGLYRWVENEALKAIKRFARRLGREKFLEYTGRIAGNVDELDYTPELWQAALKENIAISLMDAYYTISQLPREPWIGENYAYQVPAYYYALRAIAKRGSLSITHREVIEEALRGD